MLPPAEPGPRTSDRLSHVSELTCLGDADWEQKLEALGSILQQYCRTLLYFADRRGQHKAIRGLPRDEWPEFTITRRAYHSKGFNAVPRVTAL